MKIIFLAIYGGFIVIRQMVVNNFNTQSIRRIGVVGGFKGFENDPLSNDYKFVMPTLNYWRRSGLAVSDNPEFDAINFENKRNFLDENQEYDAVLIAYVRNGRRYHHLRGADTPSTFRPDSHITDRKTLSQTLDKKNTPERWNERIHRSNAKIIACNGGPYEVILPWMENSQFVTFATPRNDDELLYMNYEPFSKKEMGHVQGEQLDLPFQWLGIGVRHDFLKANLSSIQSGQTDLSRKAKTCNLTPA